MFLRDRWPPRTARSLGRRTRWAPCGTTSPCSASTAETAIAVAVAAAGLVWPEPHLLIADRLDPDQQAHRGWSDEQWAMAALRVGHRDSAALDEATDTLAAPAYAVLGPDGLAVLAAALEPLAAAAAAQVPFPNAMGLPDVTHNPGLVAS